MPVMLIADNFNLAAEDYRESMKLGPFAPSPATFQVSPGRDRGSLRRVRTESAGSPGVFERSALFSRLAELRSPFSPRCLQLSPGT